MPRHDDRVLLRHMLDYASEAVALVRGHRREDLQRDRMLELALTRLVEIVGEAAARVTEATRLHHPAIPWQQITGTRNRLIHGYTEVDCDVLWDTAIVDLPPLIELLQRIVNSTGHP
jgi:uncharacterized protein with HEPN domain